MSLSLQSKITLQSILATLIVSIAVAWLAASKFNTTSQNSIQSESTSQAEAINIYLSNWYSDRERTMSTVRKHLESVLKQNSENEDQILSILQQAQASLGFGMTFLGLENGRMYRHDPSLNSADYDPRVRSWYKDAKASQQTYVTAPYVSASTQKLSMTFVEPVIVDGKFVGAIGGLVFLDDLLNRLLELKVLGQGELILLRQTGDILAHRNKTLIQKNITESTYQINADDIKQALNGHVYKEIKDDGVAKYLYLQELGKTNWVLALVMDKATLMAPMKEFTTTASLFVVILLAVIALIVFKVSQWLLKDLKNVTARLKDIANGDGDLSARLTNHSKDEVAELVNAFNQFVERLQGTVNNIKAIEGQLSQQAQSINQTSSHSHNRLLAQQSSITMVATAVNEMAQATQEIADNALETAQNADNAVSSSESGQAQIDASQHSIQQLANDVSSVSEVIQRVSQDAENINSILKTISDIAEQTNLLALNAAIEAARAGEQGRGFAVVADEVRVLSQRTYSSIEEIQKMIENLQHSSSNAVTQIQRSHEQAERSVQDIHTARESFEEIKRLITSISDRATQIASATEEQTSVTKGISENTTEVDDGAREMVTFAHENAETARQLAQLTSDLKDNVHYFKS
ncbi:methyl-accepting chemotaxis protein [Marinomonas fungiae]|uniref:Methyl-accepting chemotaxis sensory transducer with Cache sensor n=1 Tax=Marinomonas fungiae TaxID=1137284 RepID=A0A0K6IHN4_9GAMM|nr:methyl-accepting chemotaxis protein [Marinomonas fungiae]CUB02610.1 methyl-accepting chemotaxis sensory transducer with Cache sensor [Marinomonas fungiae]